MLIDYLGDAVHNHAIASEFCPINRTYPTDFTGVQFYVSHSPIASLYPPA